MKFDPFTFLSLPLPLESSTSLEIIGECTVPFYYHVEGMREGEGGREGGRVFCIKHEIF